MQIFDQKTTYFSAEGVRLAAGSLLVYKYGTTDLADIFSDSGFTIPAANPFTLSSAGWTTPQIYANESVTVHVRDFMGNDVKVYDEISSANGSGTSTGNYAVVDTIEDLRALEPVDGALVSVKGYYSVGDCYIRDYIYVASSVLTDNGGAVIQSGVMPTGRWLLQLNGEKVDARVFGVISGIADVNSQMRAVQGWAADNGKVVYISSGTYNYAASGTYDGYAALDVDEDVIFNRGTALDPVEANWYKWNLYNPYTKIRGKLAGVSVKLTINGTGWENTIVPITAFNNTNCRGYGHGTAVFHLFFNETGKTYRWESTCEFSAVSIIHGYTASQYVMPGSQVTVDHIEGWGTINFPQSNDTWLFHELDSSYINDRLSYCMVNTDEIIYLKTPVTLHSGADITAYIEASGLGTLNNTAATCKIRGGYGGKPKFIIANYGLDVGYNTIDHRYFNSPNGMIRSWNASANATGILDMGGKVATDNITKYGKIYNGTVDGVTVSCELENVTVNGDVLGADLTAKYSTISGNVPNIVSSNLNNVTINGTGTVNCSYGVWNEVNIPNGAISSSGAFRLTNVFVGGNATFKPNISKEFCNASWVGGSALGIYFDASIMTQTGEAVAYNVTIQHLLNLTNNINTVSGSTKKWAVNGHFNVRIGDNEGTYTRRTYGSVDGTVNNSAGFKEKFWVTSSSIFYFPASAPGTKIENGSVSIVTGINKPFVAAPTFDQTYPNTWYMFGSWTTIYLQFIQNFVGGVVAGDNCTIHFQLYK